MQPAITDAVLVRGPDLARSLRGDDRERFVHHAVRLIDHTSWEAAQGFALDEPIVVTIAAHAALLVAGFDPATNPYRDVTAVVVHGGTIVTREVVAGPAGKVVSDGPRYLAGQAGPGRGPIVLDWRTAARELAHPERGVNVVYHEFAHKLDQLDGLFDGRPPLGSDSARAEWDQTFGTNLRRLRRRGRDPVVRIYAATNAAEYFAVTSELFFTLPVDLQQHHPRIYARLAHFYRQDPAASSAPQPWQKGSTKGV